MVSRLALWTLNPGVYGDGLLGGWYPNGIATGQKEETWLVGLGV